MLQFITIATFAWLTLCAGYSIHRLASGDERSIHFVLLVFFLFCGLPLGMDLVIGQPQYGDQPNYHRVSGDEPTCLIYCIWMAAVPPICLYFQPRKRPTGNKKQPRLYDLKSSTRVACYLIFWSPLLSLFVAPNPSLYLTYAATLTVVPTPAEMDFDSFKSILCMLAVLMMITMLISIRTISLGDVTTMFASAIQVSWLHGKRSIIAVILLGCLYGLWKRGVLRGARMWLGMSVAATFMIVATYSYQSAVRGFSMSEQSFYYDCARVDFCRDAVIKQAIYAEIYKSPMVLEYRGQSLLFYVTFLVPRKMWPGKPWPYAIYATATMLERAEYEDIGWGMTTSLLDELLVNIGWLGTICAPMFLSLLCRLGDGCNSALLGALTVLVGCLFMVLHLSAFMPLFLLWLAAVYYCRPRASGKRHLPVRGVMTQQNCLPLMRRNVA
ncbi:MAG: hypothetical protein JWP89_6226 [Schlesneria sp.]|nr:hypothetical protein [Schlesneria sp.]